MSQKFVAAVLRTLVQTVNKAVKDQNETILSVLICMLGHSIWQCHSLFYANAWQCWHFLASEIYSTVLSIATRAANCWAVTMDAYYYNYGLLCVQDSGGRGRSSLHDIEKKWRKEAGAGVDGRWTVPNYAYIFRDRNRRCSPRQANTQWAACTNWTHLKRIVHSHMHLRSLPIRMPTISECYVLQFSVRIWLVRSRRAILCVKDQQHRILCVRAHSSFSQFQSWIFNIAACFLRRRGRLGG